MNNKQSGFTLIELVVVIVILGILAAVAVPKFVSIQGDARLSVMRGVEAAVRSTADLVHAKALALGSPASLPIGSIEGVAVVTPLAFGYPTTAIMSQLVNIPANSNITVTAATALFQINGVTTPANCRVQYTQPAAINGVPNIVVPAPGVVNCN